MRLPLGDQKRIYLTFCRLMNMRNWSTAHLHKRKKNLNFNMLESVQEVNNAQSNYYQRLTENKIDDLFEDIQNDPVLKQHSEEQLPNDGRCRRYRRRCKK
jgi:polyribonucleotide nucleotidyltransferase